MNDDSQRVSIDRSCEPRGLSSPDLGLSHAHERSNKSAIEICSRMATGMLWRFGRRVAAAGHSELDENFFASSDDVEVADTTLSARASTTGPPAPPL